MLRNGIVSIVISMMPYSLGRLFSSREQECLEFKKRAHTYNNSLAFISFAAKYDHDSTKNNRGIYTFLVQGQVYNLLSSLVLSAEKPVDIQLYFYDDEEELSNRLYNSSNLQESTLKLLM